MSKFNIGEKVYHAKYGYGLVEAQGAFLDSAFVRFDGVLYNVLDLNLTLAENQPKAKEDRFAVIFDGAIWQEFSSSFNDAEESAKRLSSEFPGSVVEIYKRVTVFSSEVSVREVA